MLAGPPCAGKSSLARHLVGLVAGELVLVQVDAVFDLLLPRSSRTRADRMLAYDAAHAVARTVVASGRDVLLECTYARREQRAGLVAALRDRPEVPVRLVELRLSPGEAVRRFRGRSEPTDLDEEALRARVHHFPYSDEALWLDAESASTAALAEQVSDWLATTAVAIDRDRWVADGRAWDDRPAGSETVGSDRPPSWSG